MHPTDASLESENTEIFSMVHFPVFDDDVGKSEKKINDGIFNRLSKFFRPSSSNNLPGEVRGTNENNLRQDSYSYPENSPNEEPTIQTNKEIQMQTTMNNGLLEQRKFWMPDSVGSQCYECHEQFTTFKRRHHCRLCGQIFCKFCSNRQVEGKDLGYYGILRLCNFCADQLINTKASSKQQSEKVILSKIISTQESVREIRNSVAKTKINDKQLSPIDSFHSSLNISSQESTLNTVYMGQKFNNIYMESEELKNCNITDSINVLDSMFEQKMNILLDTLIAKEHLGSTCWKPLLWGLSQQIMERLTMLTLSSNDIKNALDFMHIKKLHMDIEPSFEIINGVAFTGTLLHSSMPTTIKNLHLMILGGTVSYERVLEKFTSIEPMLAQEKLFFRLQCDRVLSTHVSLLICENSMPLAALNLLKNERISVVSDVKRKVLKRISIAVGTEILNSLDAQFLQPRVGIVQDFSQREYTSYKGKRKRIILLENCDGDFGFTILLKGQKITELMAAKRILRFLVLFRYSSRLEISFLSMFKSIPKELTQDSNAANVSFQCHICELNRRNNKRIKVSDDNANRISTEIQLCNSPAIQFSPPIHGYHKQSLTFDNTSLEYLSHDHLAQLKLMADQQETKFKVLEDDEYNKRLVNNRISHEMIDIIAKNKPEELLDLDAWKKFRVSSALHFRRKAELNRRARYEKLAGVHDLLFEKSNDAEYVKSLARTDILNPYNHQGLSFLFCAIYKRTQNARVFCMGPYVLQKLFYEKERDTSLGNFLFSYCFNADYKCKDCERTMMDHLRRIVHRNVRLEITTNNLSASNRNNTIIGPVSISNPFGAGAAIANVFDADFGTPFLLDELPSAIPNTNCQQIICWLRCDRCSANSTIVQMPDAVFHLSFAKFVDYLANGTHWISPFPSSTIDFHQCLHCTFHTHRHYFALGNIITCFRVYPIYPLDVVFSPIPCAIQNEIELLTYAGKNFSIRNVTDTKGMLVTDVASVIAHALMLEKYEVAADAPQHNQQCQNTATITVDRLQNDDIEVVFSDDAYQYIVKIYFAKQLERYRSLIFKDGEDCYIQSLSTSLLWYPQGGKSGATFFRTENERFVLKTLSRFELDHFKSCAQNYIDYVNLAVVEHKLTALCKIFGAYSVNCTNKKTGQSIKNDYLVMEYIFYNKEIKQIWDLKGSLRNRFASTKTNGSSTVNDISSSVLLDENYIQNLWRNQMYITPHSKALLSQAVVNDSNFLASLGIMDYSLLAGISRGEDDEVVVGIVDYMRTFTLDKRVESLVVCYFAKISFSNFCENFTEDRISHQQFTNCNFTRTILQTILRSDRLLFCSCTGSMGDM